MERDREERERDLVCLFFVRLPSLLARQRATEQQNKTHSRAPKPTNRQARQEVKKHIRKEWGIIIIIIVICLIIILLFIVYYYLCLLLYIYIYIYI